MLERLLQINAEAFAGRQFEVAYHTLLAALHIVDDAHDRQGLERIARTVAEQGGAMQAASSLFRLYDTLRVHADAVRLRMDSAEQAGRRSGTPAR